MSRTSFRPLRPRVAPRLEHLEDRTVPSASALDSLLPNSPAKNPVPAVLAQTTEVQPVSQPSSNQSAAQQTAVFATPISVADSANAARLIRSVVDRVVPTVASEPAVTPTVR